MLNSSTVLGSLVNEMTMTTQIVSEVFYTGVSIDSRLIQPGMLFVAIRGESFDGHHFINEALSKGAAGIICEYFEGNTDTPIFRVKDTVKALALLATTYREQLPCRTIALTGSNGKTTVKEMIAAILPAGSYATRGNLNNHIGVPLCVFELTDETQCAVFELGASHIHEIGHTVRIVKPEVALINNIGPAHIAGFGSIEGVVKAKGEIYEGLGPEGTAIVNADDAYAHAWDEVLQHKRIYSFSRTRNTDFYAENVQLNDRSCASFKMVFPDENSAIVHLKVPGLHQVSNALAAAACAYAIGIGRHAIIQGLNHFEGVKGRMIRYSGIKGCMVIDDTYNANPRSTLAAIDVLSRYSGHRILVLGDMLELGDDARSAHEEVGLAAKTAGINKVFTCGALSHYTAQAFGVSGVHYETQAALINALNAILTEDTTILVKGSRSSKMEGVVQKITSPIKEKI